MAKPKQLAMDPPMTPPRILSSKSEYERLDRCCGCGTSGALARGVIPRPGDEPAVPAEQRARGNREDLLPARAMHQSRQRGKPEPVCGLVTDRPGQLPTKHDVLVPQHEKLRTLAASLRSSTAGTVVLLDEPSNPCALDQTGCSASAQTWNTSTSPAASFNASGPVADPSLPCQVTTGGEPQSTHEQPSRRSTMALSDRGG
jgi:hypothetical protein